MTTPDNLEPKQAFGIEYCLIKAAQLESSLRSVALRQLILRHALKGLLGQDMNRIMKGVDKAQLILY